jgi:uncharacterized radical SAM superfamily Fe-S cluster-containing enzyme
VRKEDGLPAIWCWAGLRKTLTESESLTDNYYGDGSVYYAQDFKYEDVVKLLHKVSKYEHEVEDKQMKKRTKKHD